MMTMAMMPSSTCRLSLLLLVVAASLIICHYSCEGYIMMPAATTGFVRGVLPKSRLSRTSQQQKQQQQQQQRRGATSSTSTSWHLHDAVQGHTEYSVVDSEGEQVEEQEERGGNSDHRPGDLFLVNDDHVPSFDDGTGQQYQRRQRQQQGGGSTTGSRTGTGTAVVEYGALRPGTVVKVQVGDLALARKAWKKRRRTGSPLLVPCSILNVDRVCMVRWNLIFLLEKFGQSSTKNKKDGMIEISIVNLAKTYRSYLKSSLERQVRALGYESNTDMINGLFNKKVQEWYGVKLKEKEHFKADGKTTTSVLYLEAPVSRHKAQSRTKNTPLLQFRLDREGDNVVEGGGGVQAAAAAAAAAAAEVLTHTGYVRALRDASSTSVSVSASDEESPSASEEHPAAGRQQEKQHHREYTFLPLSAALRVSQKDEVDMGLLEEGSIHAAVVFEYEKIGDGGSPLLTLSLNPRGVRDKLKINPDRRYQTMNKQPKHLFRDLAVGDGPYRAKVVKLQRGKALVDLEVGREVSSVGTVKVMGNLHFRDAVVPLSDSKKSPPQTASNSPLPFVEFDDEDDDDEDLEGIIVASIDDLDMLDDDEDDDEDEEEDVGDIANDLLALRSDLSFEDGTFEENESEEDISHLFQMDEDGNLMYSDPTTGSLTVVDDGANIDIEEEEEESVEADIPDAESDDVTDEAMLELFTENDDGSVTYHDPETGETMAVDRDDPTFQDLKIMQSLIDEISVLEKVPVESKTTNQEEQSTAPVSSLSSPTPKKPKFVSKQLKEGDSIDVYILAVSKQSNQFQVTTNPLIQGRTAKDLKKEGDARKKRNRLKRSLGGDFKTLFDMKGKELNGIVKATSKAGDWVYVQPEMSNLPVGVATLEMDLSDIVPGDNVRVRIDGVDEKRGQLALKVISKLAP